MASRFARARIRVRELLGKNISYENDYVFDGLGPGDVAIDCGANVGKMTERLAATGATVYAFEPDPLAFQRLRERQSRHVADGGWERVTLDNRAVGTEPGTARLFFSDRRDVDADLYSECSSLYGSKRNMDPESGVDVEIVDVIAFIEEFDRVKVLKIDIEGAEVPILEAILDRRLHERIDLTVCETHEKQIPELRPRFKEIRRRIRREGIGNINLNWH